ncbi:hypothetical protein [Microlunatus soli]|uniref:Uncharacterized protein n=1 Tax=Microlunatus soli TaxID=630515 RepID=A0A1H1T9D2_9ACTN|nr:hypothetical protein [Microlunatus soli]SDS56827.1 hypothetical protein SAMN04489812_2307 [Microlunatus soli]
MQQGNISTATSPVGSALRLARIALIGYLGLGGLLLIIDLIFTGTGHGVGVSSFMWGRSAGVVGSGAAFLWFAAAASQGRRWAFRRLQIVSIVVPIVIVGLMIIPDVAPSWFKIIQLGCAACLGGVAVVINAPRVRAAFR